MKTIADLMKHPKALNVRVETGNTWLVWASGLQRWEVYHAKSYASTGQLVTSTSDEAEAVAAFVRVSKLEDGEEK